MKFLIVTLAIFLSHIAIAQSDSLIEKRLTFLISKYYDAGLDSSERVEIKSLIYQIQNKAFRIWEADANPTEALIEIDRALSLWIILRDTLNEANLRKFRGLLLGKMKRFDEGKSEIAVAIRLYGIKQREFGIAVSEFDLSKVYEYENKLDSSEFYAFKSLNYWIPRKDTFRILTGRNQILNLFLKSKNYNNASKWQIETESFLSKKDLHWQPVLDFYYISHDLYLKKRSTKNRDKYQALYNQKLKLLEKGGIVARTSYK